MIRHHCGAENADQANFCSGCGEKIQPSAISDTKACPTCGAANKAQAKFCGKCGSGMTVATPAPQQAGMQPPASTNAASAPARKSASQTALLMAGAVLLGIALAGGAWWLAKSKTPPVTEAPASVAPTAASATMAPHPAPNTSALAASSAAASSITERPAAPADATQARAHQGTAPPAGEPKARHRKEAEPAHRTASAAPERKKEEAPRAAQSPQAVSATAQASGQSVQAICASRTNPIAHDMCETRECARPSQFNTPDCVAFRKRYEQSNNVQY